MRKIPILCNEKNGGSCRNKVSLASNYVCAAGHGREAKNNSNLSAPPEKLTVVNLSEMSIKQRVNYAKNSLAEPETLDELARDPDLRVIHAVAQNRSAPPETLARMAKNNSLPIRAAVGGNTSTAPETLAQMAEDDLLPVLVAVGGNTSTAPETLAKMSKNEDSNIRWAVASNTSASLETLDELAEEASKDLILSALAMNTSTAPKTYISLAQKGQTPYGFTMSKSIDELTKGIELVNQYPDTFGEAYLNRLLDDSTPEDETHPKRRALISYVYAKYAESDTSPNQKRRHKDKIKAFFPNDQEMAEMIGY